MTVILMHYANLYGANTSLLEYLSNTRRPREEFTVILPHHGTAVKRLEELGIPYIIQWFPLNIHDKATAAHVRIWRGVKKLRSSFLLYRTIKKLKPAILYSNSSIIYHGFYISRLLRIPHVWHLREFGWEDYRLKHDFGLNVFRKMLRSNTCNIAISNVIAAYYGLKGRQGTKVIYNGVVLKDKLSQPELLPGLSDTIRFGIVGIITPYKNQLNLIKAFHEFIGRTNARSVLYIIGESGHAEYFQSVNDYIRENDLASSVIMAGHLSERSHIYSSFDVLLNGAEFEGFGRVTAEAMSFGKVPVAINRGGNAELIEDKTTGLLFESFDDLPELLGRLNKDRDYLLSLRAKMLQHFNIRFTVEYYCAEIDALLKKLQLHRKAVG